MEEEEVGVGGGEEVDVEEDVGRCVVDRGGGEGGEVCGGEGGRGGGGGEEEDVGRCVVEEEVEVE